jgi:hypothetical protein
MRFPPLNIYKGKMKKTNKNGRKVGGAHVIRLSPAFNPSAIYLDIHHHLHFMRVPVH